MSTLFWTLGPLTGCAKNKGQNDERRCFTSFFLQWEGYQCSRVHILLRYKTNEDLILVTPFKTPFFCLSKCMSPMSPQILCSVTYSLVYQIVRLQLICSGVHRKANQNPREHWPELSFSTLKFRLDFIPSKNQEDCSRKQTLVWKKKKKTWCEWLHSGQFSAIPPVL